MGPSNVISWFIDDLTMIITITNHSYCTYNPTERYPTGAQKIVENKMERILNNNPTLKSPTVTGFKSPLVEGDPPKASPRGLISKLDHGLLNPMKNARTLETKK